MDRPRGPKLAPAHPVPGLSACRTAVLTHRLSTVNRSDQSGHRIRNHAIDWPNRCVGDWDKANTCSQSANNAVTGIKAESSNQVISLGMVK